MPGFGLFRSGISPISAYASRMRARSISTGIKVPQYGVLLRQEFTRTQTEEARQVHKVCNLAVLAAESYDIRLIQHSKEHYNSTALFPYTEQDYWLWNLPSLHRAKLLIGVLGHGELSPQLKKSIEYFIRHRLKHGQKEPWLDVCLLLGPEVTKIDFDWSTKIRRFQFSPYHQEPTFGFLNNFLKNYFEDQHQFLSPSVFTPGC